MVQRPVARILPALSFALIMLLPALALADGSETSKFREVMEGYGLVAAVGVSFLAGIAASLTPCVFPMVPITVSIFGATETSSRARGAALSATFVLGIATLFTPLGVVSAMTGSLMGTAMAKAWVVIGFALLFAALAASMFGAFEMTLPSSLNNKLSTVGGVGFRGAFVLGVVLGLIAAPCTGPFLTGLLAWIAETRDVYVGSSAMFSFALGLGLPFFLTGAFALNLPKGGAWMLGIKWGSGVVLAYMALAYLRDRFPAVASLAHGGTFYGMVALAIFAVGLTLGTVHILAERRKSPIAHLSKPMKLASIAPAVIGTFMLFSWFKLQSGVPGVPEAAAACPDAPPIAWMTDEKAALAKAASEKKPLLVDFGATWCGACMELEEKTWPTQCVRAEVQRFVALKVDATDDELEEPKRLEQKYKVIGLPTVVLMDSTGQEQSRFTEFVAPNRMVGALRSVK